MAEEFVRRGSPGGLGDNPSGRGGGDRPGDRTREVAEDVRQKATSLAHEARNEGKQALGQQKDVAADQVGSVASALRSAADDLQRRDERAGRFVSYAAERLETFGHQVRNKDIDTLIEDAERLGRRSPAAFFAGSVAIGFLLSRFLKSSSRSRTHDTGRAERSSREDVLREPVGGVAAADTAPMPLTPPGSSTYPSGPADRPSPSVTSPIGGRIP